MVWIYYTGVELFKLYHHTCMNYELCYNQTFDYFTLHSVQHPVIKSYHLKTMLVFPHASVLYVLSEIVYNWNF